MKTGIASPEKNNGQKLTIPVKTRSPLEAFKMLRAGQPVDQLGNYYHDQGLVGKDFFLLDKVEKLHKIAELKEREADLKADYDSQLAVYNEQIKQQQYAKDQIKAGNEADTRGAVPQ